MAASEVSIGAGPNLVMSARRRWAVTIGVMTGMFLAALEATVVGTAMPTVIASLGGLSHYSWVFSAYLITSTVSVPVWGKLSDLYGRRICYQVGIAVFLIGSMLSGIATSMTELIAYRAVQGLGAGALVPLGMTIIGDIFTLAERARMQAFFSGVWGLASVLGPIVGGFITDQLNWRWVFFINLPVGLAAAIVMGMALREPKRLSRPKIDYAGAGALTASITLLMLALVEGGASADTLLSSTNMWLIGGALVLGVLFVRIERRAVDPIVPLAMFRNPVVKVATIVGLLAGVAMFGAISFIPLYAQGVLGSTATEAGSLLTPLMLSWVLLSVVGGRLLLRVGYRRLSITGLSLMTLGFLLLTLHDRELPRVWLYGELVIIGPGLGLTMLTLLIAVQQAVPRAQLGVATAMNQFSRSIGGAVGVAIMGAVLTAGLVAGLEDAAAVGGDRAAQLPTDAGALITPESRAGLSPEVLTTLADTMDDALKRVFMLGTLLAACALLAALALPRSNATVEPAHADPQPELS